LILLAAASPTAPIPLLDAKIVRSLDDFSACFTKTEEVHGRAWAYLAGEGGGTFTDSGAQGSPGSYWLQVRGAGGATRVQLFAAETRPRSSSLVEAVGQCR